MSTGRDYPDIVELERDLLRVETRGDRAALERLLAPDFVEFGSSGRIYSKTEVIDALLRDPAISEAISLDMVVVRPLSSDIVLLTYIAIGDSTGRRVNRSSIWVRSGEGWRMAFHQATIAAARQGSR